MSSSGWPVCVLKRGKVASPACSHLEKDSPCKLALGQRPPVHARKRRTTSSACSEEPGCLAGHRAWHPDEAGSQARAVRGAATHTKGCPRQARGTVAILAQGRAQGTRRGWPRGKRGPLKILERKNAAPEKGHPVFTNIIYKRWDRPPWGCFRA